VQRLKGRADLVGQPLSEATLAQTPADITPPFIEDLFWHPILFRRGMRDEPALQIQ
jgi:hypothetical protein